MNEETSSPPLITLRELLTQRYMSLGIYAGIGFFTAAGEVFESDAANTLLGPMVVFAGNSICYVTSATLLAIKMVMSSSWETDKPKPPADPEVKP
jgi:hypothetical protein